MAIIDMRQHDTISAVLDLDSRIALFKAQADRNRLDADHPEYDESYEESYYAELEQLRWKVLTEYFEPKPTKQ